MTMLTAIVTSFWFKYTVLDDLLSEHGDCSLGGKWSSGLFFGKGLGFDRGV